MPDKLTACRDCKHVSLPSDGTDRVSLVECAKWPKFDFFFGVLDDIYKLCSDINTDGHCLDFKEKHD